MVDKINYPRLQSYRMTIIPRADQIGRGYWMGTLIGVYDDISGDKQEKIGVVCYSVGENYCPTCPLFNDCPRPFGFKEPRHNNSILAEKVKLSIV